MEKVSFSNRLVIHGEPIVWGFAVGRVFYYQDILTREIEKKAECRTSRPKRIRTLGKEN